jgi:hypothetical protein
LILRTFTSASGNLGGSSYTYADTISYNAAGQMTKERFGTATSLYHNLHYNNRLQLVDIRLGDSPTDEDWRTLSGSLHDECVTHPHSRVGLSQSHHASRDSTIRECGWVTHLPSVC